MKRLKVVSSLLMIVLSPILLGGCEITDSDSIETEIAIQCSGNPDPVGCAGEARTTWRKRF